MYPLVESTHVLTLCLFLGMAIMFDLRLLGVTLVSVPMTEIRRRLGPWMLAGFVVMVITGLHAVLRDSGTLVPEHLLPHQGRDAGPGRPERVRVPRDHRSPRSPSGIAIRCRRRAARRAGAASLVLWAVIVVAGRMIAYNWFDCDKQPQPQDRQRGAGCVVPARGIR